MPLDVKVRAVPVVMCRFDFDYGHRVLSHEGKCRDLHGHRGVAEVYVDSPQLDALGRVVDFDVMKNGIGGWIDENWDHNFLVHKDDPLIFEKSWRWDVKSKNPYIMSNGNPTAENVAEELFRAASEILYALDPKLKVAEVVFWQTANYSALCRSLPPVPVLKGAPTEEFLKAGAVGESIISSLPPEAILDAAKRVRFVDRGLTFTMARDFTTGHTKVMLTSPPPPQIDPGTASDHDGGIE